MTTRDLARWLKGDREAIDFILNMHQIAEAWDDLIDDDASPTPEQINRAFYTSLITIPRNGFFQRHFATLSPLLEVAILDWHTANAFENSGSAENLRAAFILRCGLMSLTTMAACILAGPEWAQEVNSELRSLGDTWDDYRKKHEVT